MITAAAFAGLAGLDPLAFLENEDPFTAKVAEAVSARSQELVDKRIDAQAKATAKRVADLF